MKRIVVGMSIAVLSICATHCGIGINGSTGLAFSNWKMDIRNQYGVWLADHLESRGPVVDMGIALSLWATRTLGVRAGLEYGWHTYNYTYDYTTDEDAIDWKWKYKNLIIPIDFVFGIPMGRSRGIIGAGLYIVKQLDGEWSGVIWGQDEEPRALSGDVLETTISPRFLTGIEIRTGDFGLCPAVYYVHRLGAVSKELAGTISTNSLNLSLAVLYFLSSD